MIGDDHPFFFLDPLFGREDSVFSFSRYVYTPDSLFDERELLEVVGSELSVEWLDEQLNRLRPNQELAIHSNVWVKKRTFHIPMLDFSTDQLASEDLNRIKAFLPMRVFATSSFYQSGRSFHAYSRHLLEPREWYDFLGRALLINPRDGRQIVDTRWIGHRLIAGYCSLRFSNNSGQYRSMPRQVSIRELAEIKPRVPMRPTESVRPE